MTADLQQKETGALIGDFLLLTHTLFDLI
jgi:hypothetical protein